MQCVRASAAHWHRYCKIRCALKELPVPTHAFIGGSSGNLKEIVALLLEKNRDVRIVINCITLETISEALEILKEYDFADQEAVQLTASRDWKIPSNDGRKSYLYYHLPEPPGADMTGVAFLRVQKKAVGEERRGGLS